MAFKIVVADDESHICHVVSMKLLNAGYEVLTAVDGEEALELCLSEHPDLLITDFQMPVLTGVEVANQAHSHEELKSLPVLMLTARGFDIESQEMNEAGIADVLSKPFSPREVLNKVQMLLQGAGSTSAKEEPV
jgi:two-component system, OmpR family, alkaline phosphatase synthesis response regulator PhoP